MINSSISFKVVGVMKKHLLYPMPTADAVIAIIIIIRIAAPCVVGGG